jgi:Cdc6-like AAA superfamily ATPase
LTHPLIAAWLDGPTHNLWVHGGPGTGKSVLAAYLIDFVQERIKTSKNTTQSSSSEVLLYFFCDGRSTASLKASSDSIALTLLTQLVDNPDFRPENFPLFANYVTSASTSFNFPVGKLVEHLMVILGTFSKAW